MGPRIPAFPGVIFIAYMPAALPGMPVSSPSRGSAKPCSSRRLRADHTHMVSRSDGPRVRTVATKAAMTVHRSAGPCRGPQHRRPRRRSPRQKAPGRDRPHRLHRPHLCRNPMSSTASRLRPCGRPRKVRTVGCSVTAGTTPRPSALTS